MIHREEKNITNIRNVGITFKNTLSNLTGYVLEVELLTRFDEGSKTVVVQIINLIPGVEYLTVNNLKPCSIYKFNIVKEDREMMKLARAISSFNSFYIFTGNTDHFKSNIPLNNQDNKKTIFMHGAMEKHAHAHLKSAGIKFTKIIVGQN